MLDLITVASAHPSALMAGIGAGMAIAAGMRIIRRMERMLVRAAVLALTGSAGAGGTAALVHALGGWW